MCDSLCLLDVHPPLFAKNSDRPVGEAQAIEWHAPRRDRRSVRTTHIEIEPWLAETIGFIGSRPTWMWGVEHGLNEAGVAIGNHTVFTTLDPRPAPAALTGMDLVRLGLERGASASAAVAVITDLLDRYGQGGPCHPGGTTPYWSTFLVADPTDAFVIDTSGSTWAVEPVDRRRAVSNRPAIDEFRAEHAIVSPRIEARVDPRRFAASIEFVSSDAGTIDDVKRHLRSHVGGADGWTICMHVDGDEATNASMIATLEAHRPVARMLLGSPCQSIYVPLAVGPVAQPPGWEEFALVGDDARPARDELEAELERDFRADDPAWPAEAWRRLRRLGAIDQHRSR